MITGELIEKAVDAKLEGTSHFLTEVDVTATGKIYVYIDSFEKFGIDDCVTVNRALRKEFGEALDEYDLTVSSAGMDRAFRHMKQYHKNLDREVAVVLEDGQKLEGLLTRVTDEGIELLEVPKVPKKGMVSKKKTEPKTHAINFSQIKETKRVITF